MAYNLRISNKYGSVAQNKFLTKSVTTLKLTHSKYASFPRFQIDVCWLKFSLKEELTYEIDGWFQEKILTNDALDLTWSPAFYV
jgi:hypothetical protein